VTGGSGFIGSHVIDRLIDVGVSARVIDRQRPHRGDVEWRPADLRDLQQMVDATAGADVVMHLAAMADVNDVIESPTDAVATNTVGTANVLEASRRNEVGRVVLASTVWVYSASKDAVVDETTPIDLETDRHLYVSTKIAAEMICRDYLYMYGLPYTVLRFGIPYGPRMRSRMVIGSFIERALQGEPLIIEGDGAQERSFVYVEDLARAHLLALDERAANRTYNLEGAERISIRQLAELVRELVGDTVIDYRPGRPGDYAAREVSAQRALDELGWRPEVSFAEGLERTIAWFRRR
jgi:UDP-glucose 4-epimerase